MAAKKGNKNALKHGIYSHFIAVVDEKDMQGMSDDDVADELALSRARLAHANKERDAATDPKDKLAWDYACRHWTEIIGTLKSKKIEKRQTEISVFKSIREAIDYWNDKQGIVK